MSLDTVENRNWAYTLFPGLINDPHFKITSPKDQKYNCIAWANQHSDIWWWPYPSLDGVCEWPIPDHNSHESTLIALFESRGFILCDDWQFDKAFVKVALYVDNTGDFTHAARQDRAGLWKSKLGPSFDIVHGSPQSIENQTYGSAKHFMKSKF